MPAGPRTFSRAKPAKFWPMSNTKTPGFGSVIFTGCKTPVSCTVTPGNAWSLAGIDIGDGHRLPSRRDPHSRSARSSVQASSRPGDPSRRSPCVAS